MVKGSFEMIVANKGTEIQPVSGIVRTAIAGKRQSQGLELSESRTGGIRMDLDDSQGRLPGG
jgi:hypothetical protein